MIRVEGHKNLYRDEKSGAIINTDSSAYASYHQRNAQKRMERLEIDQMKTDIADMKGMLAKIMEKL